MTDTAPAWNPEQPHNQLPALPPAHELETRAALKACIEARAALAELKQAAQLIPNQTMLINTIPLLEAKDSSEIENIVTTTDQLFQYAQGHDNADPATKEALRYRTALHQGFQSLKVRPLCTATAVDVCRTLKGVDMDIRRTPGTQLANDRTGEVVYTPPEGEARVRDMLADWERFLHNETELDPLIRMAVGHYQFEAIHPFTDGNGRTGRVLNILYLIQEELLNLPILYLGRHPHAGRTHHRTVAHAPDRQAVAACSVVTHSGAPPRACCARFEREPTSEGRAARGHDARGGRPPACAGWHIACMRCAHEYDDRNESHRVRVRRSHAAGELDLPIL